MTVDVLFREGVIRVHFFTEGKDGGCSIRKRYKPFGCLGFNAIDSGVRDGENCKSYLSTLEDREREHGASEEQLNAQIRQELGLDWEKEHAVGLKELFSYEKYQHIS